MKKIITALTLSVMSTLFASTAMAQTAIQTAQPVAPAVVGRTITEQPQPKAVAKKAKSGKSGKHASAKKNKKGSKKVSTKSGSKVKAKHAKHKMH